MFDGTNFTLISDVDKSKRICPTRTAHRKYEVRSQPDQFFEQGHVRIAQINLRVVFLVLCVVSNEIFIFGMNLAVRIILHIFQWAYIASNCCLKLPDVQC